MSNDRPTPRVPKWPFLFADLVFLGAAAAILRFTPAPINLWQMGALLLCVIAGAWVCLLPFFWDYKAAVKLAEADRVADAVAQIQHVEELAAQISAATARWQLVQDASDKTAAAAREISERITGEARNFKEFLEKANDAERAHLRLELEKARRGEKEWLAVVIHLLDHTYALHQAAVRSGQANVIQQLGQFQNACRDIVRRVGLTSFAAKPGETLDPQMHQLSDGSAPQNTPVGETLAPGYTFQGQLLRRALVGLREAKAAAGQAPEGKPAPVEEQQPEPDPQPSLL